MSERSIALPAHFYRDPAQVVESTQLAELGCRACEHHGQMLGKVYCTEPRVTNHKRVPFIGTKCKHFKLQEVKRGHGK